MRIDRLEVRNFKMFAEEAFEFPRRVGASVDAGSFHVLVGENGSGKTSVLDALAVALGVWFVKPPDSILAKSRRRIWGEEIRLESVQQGDRVLFQEAGGGVVVKATGRIGDRDSIGWTRQRKPGQKGTDNRAAQEAIDIIGSLYARARKNQQILLPVIAYYAAGRAWLPHKERPKEMNEAKGPASRWAALFKCLSQRIRITDLNQWFLGEAIAAGSRGGRYRPGFEIVRRAVLRCVPGADGMWYDGDRREIVLSINGRSQPFNNLSAGQRVMMAVVADIAIKAVIQNNFLVPPEPLSQEDDPLPRVLAQTPGVVLIDELDVHLHPRLQRRVASNLKEMFPKIQFVCTTHSPQVIGELLPDEICLLDERHRGHRPAQSFGLDSNAILEEVFGEPSRNQIARQVIDAVDQALEEGQLDIARRRLDDLLKLQNGTTRDSARLEATINNLEALADADD